MSFDSGQQSGRSTPSISSNSREKKKKNTFLDKLIKRKDSLDGEHLRSRQSPGSPLLGGLRHSSSSTSIFAKHGKTHKDDESRETHTRGAFSKDGGLMFSRAIEPSLSYTPSIESASSKRSLKSGNNTPVNMKESDHNMFFLDTRLEDMSGIVKPEYYSKNDSSTKEKSGRRHLGKRGRLIVTHRDKGQHGPGNSQQKTGTSNALTSAAPSPIERKGLNPPGNNGWAAPDSWGVMRTDDEIHNPMKYFQLKSPPHSRTKQSQAFYVRVFRDNGTFATISCALDTSVSELLPILGKKFFLPSVAHYQIGFRRLGLIRILHQDDRPLMIQKRMLELTGFTDEDRISDLGREDLGYICRFLFIPAVTAESSDWNSDIITGRKFTQVDLQRRNLQTIPSILNQYVSDIVSLNLSGNLSLEVSPQFIESCINLREIKFAGNECSTVPPSLLEASLLNYLDISGNRLEAISSDIQKLDALISLKAQNNCLSSIPDTFSCLRNLRHLNLAFNYFTTFPMAICELVTLLELDISFNNISELPPEIGQLCALEKFVFTNNRLMGSLPDTFQNLTSLKSLDIRYNILSNVDVVMSLPRLEVFLCSHNSVSRLEKHSKRLRVLHMNRNPVTRLNFSMPMLALTALNLTNAKMSSFPDGFFEKIPNLEKLVLDENHFGSIPSQIGRLKKLTRFSCVDNNLSSLPPEIGSLTELTHIDVHSNSLSSLPSEIWYLNRLELLNASSNLLDSFPLPLYLGSISSESGLLKSAASAEDFKRYTGESTRRSSNLSASSGHSPRDISGRRGSEFSTSGDSTLNGATTPRKLSSFAGASETVYRKDSTTSNRLANTMAQSLKYLYLADNRLSEESFKEISFLTELIVLNITYNYFSEIPSGSLARMTQLRELYLSGNNLTNLPADDLSRLSNLKVYHVNANKLLTLPAELADIAGLEALDVGSNSLKYNISNWPYDWNWNHNPALKYLNLSGNKRLEIKPSTSLARGDVDLSDFSNLTNLRVLGLMDVTITNSSVPDQTEDRRVRTSGSEVHYMPYGMADTLGKLNHLSTIDMVVERFRGNEDDVIFGLFDGQASNTSGSRVAKFLQENFASFFNEELKKLREGEAVTAALRRTFLSLNKELGICTMSDSDDATHYGFSQAGSASMAQVGPEDFSTGACATIIYIAKNRLYIANTGDVRAILSRTDGEFRLLTKKHEPAFPPEIDRIREAGGFVSQSGKLNDITDVSRSFGYFNLVPCMQAAPSMVECQLSDTDDLLIIASRELWEYINHQTAVDIAATEREDPMKAAQKLRDFAIAYGCTDKIVVMIVAVGDSGRQRVQKPRMQGLSLGSISTVEEEELFPVLKRRWARNMPEDTSLGRLGEEVSPPVGELAMVFTDIKNSTLLWETYPVAMRSAIKIHNAVMRRQLRIVGGYEVKTEGDAFMVCFPTATAAMLWCFSVQSQLLVAEWPSEITSSVDGAEVVDKENNIIYRGLSVRMGIHWGAPVCERDPITRRMDYFGPVVNRASRISAVAEGGQIAVSQDLITEIYRLENAFKKADGEVSALYELFGDDILAKAVYRDLKMLQGLGWEVKEIGEQKLKGLESPEIISLIYPRSLAARMKAMPIDLQKIGLNPMADLLRDLRKVSLRLERICSRLSGSATPLIENGGMGIIPIELISDEQAVVFLDHIITRIENSLAGLYVRSLKGSFYKGDQLELSVLLKGLLTIKQQI
ncbi:hypothetical protein V1511DRAFT_481732 [Dipodascopsis uninucleata]